MAIKIRENPKIKGIKVLHSEHEISQLGTTDPLAYSLSLYEKTQINSLPD
jgi:hypothetical protein